MMVVPLLSDVLGGTSETCRVDPEEAASGAGSGLREGARGALIMSEADVAMCLVTRDVGGGYSATAVRRVRRNR